MKKSKNPHSGNPSKKEGGGNHSGAPDTGISPDKNRKPRSVRTSDEIHEKVKRMAKNRGSSVADIYGDLIEKGMQTDQEGTLSKQLARSVAEIKSTIKDTYKQPVKKGSQSTQEGDFIKQLTSLLTEFKSTIKDTKQSVKKESQAIQEGVFTQELGHLFVQLKRITKSNEQVLKILIEMGIRSTGTEEATYLLFKDHIIPDTPSNSDTVLRLHKEAGKKVDKVLEYQADRVMKNKDRFSASLEEIRKRVHREKSIHQSEKKRLATLATQERTFIVRVKILLVELKCTARRNEQMSKILVEMGLDLGCNQDTIWNMFKHVLQDKPVAKEFKKKKIDALANACESSFMHTGMVASDGDELSDYLRKYVPKGDEDEDPDEMAVDVEIKKREDDEAR